jgi:riboflavin kinase / FMN adenylyltransferase
MLVVTVVLKTLRFRHSTLDLRNMQVHDNIRELPEFRNAVVTIGTFDGVHTGHRQIIEQLKKEAVAVEGETVIITFYPHPRMVLNAPGPAIKLLNTLEEKIQLLTDLEIDHLVVVPFTASFSEQTAEQYIQTFLVDLFHPHTIIIGYDHRFGKDRQGDYKLLEAQAAEFGYQVKEIPKHVLNQVAISSTKIREAISDHNIKQANEFLGYEYFFGGEVVVGKKLGRTIGFPTANIKVEDENKLIPANGVYAVHVSVKKDYSLEPNRYKGMMNIGVRPTVDSGDKVVIEVNLFDFESEIYGAYTTITVKDFMRHEIKFNGVEQLREQLEKDETLALQILNS